MLRIFVFLVSCLMFGVANACCAGDHRPLNEQVNNYLLNGHFVFKGKYLMQYRDSLLWIQRDGILAYDVFQVIESWNGIDQYASIVALCNDGSSTSYRFIKDSSYLVFGSSTTPYDLDARLLYTNICMPTGKLSQSNEVLQILGSGFIHTFDSSNAFLKPNPVLPDEIQTDVKSNFDWLQFSLFGNAMFVLLLWLVWKNGRAKS
ncbi:MAG: hypothetical protein H6607_05495 [Flavobacteriales bacterium]|nr:hypothetical protein [Flavobacteriales bacterium]